MSSDTSTERVSPTAYATGYMWYRLGMSHPALATAEGKRLDFAFGLLMYGVKRVSGTSFDAMMIARHKGIDARLARAIDQGRVGQVIEIAAGLSPRGINFAKRYGKKITYIETDLAAMANTKRKLLDDAGLLSDHHRVIEIDALNDKGPKSLAALVKTLDPNVGTAIITEGLMSYLDGDTARDVWRRFARTLKKFPHGLYLSDVYIRGEHDVGSKAFGAVLGRFVKGKIHVHFEAASQAIQALRSSGFRTTAVHEPRDIPETREIAATKGADRVRVLEATT
ncbi:class I SAM-dependent methyltransferase [Stenotrophobium rhamnosiphilum]|uniref:Class I SAM-dependent methyltransferase n=1 Tax=Stenotrophobium rhamnosiphilum TaxID=2029166 RepID=A0A2T5MG58_9GAMM|nr:class I SAM-dependent methyltransferase [Stenotrophobium rhamnosiphilum]PTU31561.1 class I SAM-dependent methyltransferase [Stenotrophobium rhamnosiphilum]